MACSSSTDSTLNIKMPLPRPCGSRPPACHDTGEHNFVRRNTGFTRPEKFARRHNVRARTRLTELRQDRAARIGLHREQHEVGHLVPEHIIERARSVTQPGSAVSRKPEYPPRRCARARTPSRVGASGTTRSEARRDLVIFGVPELDVHCSVLTIGLGDRSPTRAVSRRAAATLP